MGGEDRAKNYDDKSEMAYYWLEANMGRVLLVVAFAGLGLWGYFLEGQEGLDRVRSFIRYLGAEMAGIGIATVAIDALNEKRQRAELRAQLIRQMGSRHNDVADSAVRELAYHGWLYGDSLQGARLAGAALGGADLSRANLERAVLANANLSKATLVGANLTGADLSNATLSEAVMESAILPQAKLREVKAIETDLTDADLTEADLGGADLSGAILLRTTLRRADLTRAKLSQAELLLTALNDIKSWSVEQLKQAETVEGSIMPDGVCLRQEGSRTSARQDPTFEEWQARYLAQHGGTEADLRSGP